MFDSFSLMEIPTFKKRVALNKKGLYALAYDTIVRARTGNVNNDDQMKVCNDTYREVVANIKDTLKDVKSDYDTGKSDILTMVTALKEDLDKNITPKWNYISENASRYVNQIFLDTTSDRIYSFHASLEVLSLISDLEQFFNGKMEVNDRPRFMTRIVEKCLSYSEDKLFAVNAGKLMRDIGYIDINHVYEIANLYGSIVTAIQSDQIRDTINSYKSKVDELESNANTLDMVMSKNISKAEAIDDFTLKQYEQILAKAGALKSIHRATMVMSGLLSSMQKTVHNILDAAKLAIYSAPLKNMTDPMGGDNLNPTIIEEQVISIESLTPKSIQNNTIIGSEGFFKKILDRISTYSKDNAITNVMDKDESIRMFMDFIKEHVGDQAVAKYCMARKWRSLPLSKLKSGFDELVKVIKSQEKFLSKVEMATTYQDIFNYPITKGFNIPEIMALYNVMKKLGTNTVVGWRDRYTGKVEGMVSPDKVTNILNDDSYTLYIYYRDEGYPNLTDYLEAYDRLTKVKLMTGKELGITDINTLEDWSKFGIEKCENIRDLIDRYSIDTRSVFNKNTTAIKDQKIRDMVVGGYYRISMWAQYFGVAYSMLFWTAYMPYLIISDIKKYA